MSKQSVEYRPGELSLLRFPIAAAPRDNRWGFLKARKTGFTTKGISYKREKLRWHAELALGKFGVPLNLPRFRKFNI